MTVAVGGTLAYTITGTVPPGTAGSLINTATVTPPPGSIDAGCTPSCSASAGGSGHATVGLAVTKLAAPDPFVPGAPLTYTVRVSNTGPSDAVGVHVADVLPSQLTGRGFGWTCTASTGSSCAATGSGNIADTADVAAGGILTYTVTGTVPPGMQSSLTNTATVTPPTGASSPGCDPSCVATINTDANPTTSLAVTKTSTPNPYVPGSPLTYTVTVTNAGPLRRGGSDRARRTAGRAGRRRLHLDLRPELRDRPAPPPGPVTSRTRSRWQRVAGSST